MKKQKQKQKETKMKKKTKNLRMLRTALVLTLMLSVGAPTVRAQVTIGDSTAPQTFSVLELISNQKTGLRMPQLTTAQRNTMTETPEFVSNMDNLAKGLTIYNTTNDCLEFWNGTKWISRCTGETPPLPQIVIPTGPDAVGTGTFAGKTCFDIAYSNFDARFGQEAGRLPLKTDFADTAVQDPNGQSEAPSEATYSGTQVYTFTPSGADVSNVRFGYQDSSGVDIIESITPDNPTLCVGNVAPGTACKVTVVYKASLNNDLKTLNHYQALKPALVVVYNDKANGTGTDRYLKLNIRLQDCACCPGYLAVGGEYTQTTGTVSIAEPRKWPEVLDSNCFLATNNDLCFYKTDAGPSYMTWTSIGNKCATDDAFVASADRSMVVTPAKILKLAPAALKQ
jgi:hypothetical protein